MQLGSNLLFLAQHELLTHASKVRVPWSQRPRGSRVDKLKRVSIVLWSQGQRYADTSDETRCAELLDFYLAHSRPESQKATSEQIKQK